MTVGPEINEAPRSLGQLAVIDLIHNVDQICQKCQTWKLEIDQTTDNPNSLGYFTPEQEEILRGKQGDIDRLQSEIQKQDEKIARVDASIAFFTKYPQANYSFQAIADLYSDEALRKLIKKSEEENLPETDPTLMYRLLYDFFKGKQDLENDMKIFINTCVARAAAGEAI